MQKNENRPGYKKTKVGWIPEDWDNATLGSATSRIGDGIHATPAYIENSQYYFVNGNNLMDGRVVISSETKCVSEEEFLKHKKDLGSLTLLLSINGTVGNVAYYRNEPVILGKSAAYINCAASLNKHFAFAFLSSSKAHTFFREEWTGSTIMNLSLASLRQMHTPLPSLPEQEAIAEMLECWDRGIRNLELKIEKKRNIKKGLMQRLLTGKQRLPGFEGKGKEVRLKDLLSYKRPDRHIVRSTEYSEQQGIPVLTANKSFILGYTNETFGICHDIPVIIFDDFTVDSKYVDFPFKVKSSAIKLLCPANDQVDLRFVFESMQQLRFVVGEHKRYYISEYQYIKLPLPSYSEQRAITAVLSAADSEISSLERKLEALKAQKRFLLNNLVTGTIRLPQFRARKTTGDKE